MLTTILFDMDGLIFDTEALAKASWQYAAKQMGRELNDDFYTQFIGMKDVECQKLLCELYGASFDLQEYIQIRDEHHQQAKAQGVDFKEGFHELFNAIKQKGLSVALVTSSRLKDVERNFAGSGYLEQFDVIVSAENVTNGKPAPECYLSACEKLEVTPDQCLVLEDSNNGIFAGKRAGCQTVMIPDLAKPSEEALKHADYVFGDLGEVLTLIK